MIKVNNMDIGGKIKKIRMAKRLSQKEVAISIDMDPAQYLSIENSKSDPHLSTVDRIAKTLVVERATLFQSDEIFKDVNSVDKTMMEKISFLEKLETVENKAIFTLLDALIAKKKLTDNITNALNISA